MTILGIDPGTATVGYGIVGSTGPNLKYIAHGVILTTSQLSPWERLEIIYQELDKVIKDFRPDKAVVESLFYFKNQKTVMTVAQARGVILLTCQLNNLLIIELTPLEIKQSLTNYGRADKDQMQKMVKLILGLKAIPKPDDAADALACAIAGSQINQKLS